MARVKRNVEAIIIVLRVSSGPDNNIGDCVVIRAVSIDVNRIFMYSDIKINANIFPEYSVLNPDTNSLSPSAKSNGVRFVSAMRVVSHIRIRRGVNINGLKNR